MERQIRFGPFRLDEPNECLWEHSRTIPLRPKAFAVLKYLIGHPGRLVTKQQLLDAVWPATFVGDAVLKDSIRQVREALGDDAESPHYIETVHRRGYRFIAPTSEDLQPPTLDLSETAEQPLPANRSEAVASIGGGMLGRTRELRLLRGLLEKTLRGERQVVFITGEAGIGKTTLVDAFLKTASLRSPIWIVRGQCLEQYGSGEAYLPVLDGLSRLCRGPDKNKVIGLLQQYSPTWLSQMPSVIPVVERRSDYHLVAVSRERMLREMADAVELMSAETPIIFVLEDLHWSDRSTLDLLSFLARHRDPARAMVIGTYRPVEVVLNGNALKGIKQELRAQGLCTELTLEYLTDEMVSQYLNIRFPGHQFPRRFARLLHKRTEGNPLFMVNVAEYLVQEDFVRQDDHSWILRVPLDKIQAATPENLRQLLERHIERLSEDERCVLEGAAVAGMECSTVAIASGLKKDETWVDENCERLVNRHQFLTKARVVQLPDGTVTPRYRFSHVLFHAVPYNLIPEMRRSQIHRRIGERGELIYGQRVAEIAAELAMHFDEGRDLARAAKYLLMAAENAARCSAYHEAATLAQRGLKVLEEQPRNRELEQQEIALRTILGVSLMAVKGFAASEAEEVYGRAKELFWLQGISPQLFTGLWMLGLFYIFSGKMGSALEVAQQLLEIATGLKDPALIMEAERALGVTLVDLGRCKEALRHLDHASALYRDHGDHAYKMFIGHDCKVVSECFAARALWALGYPDHALQRVDHAAELAQRLAHAQTLVAALHFGAELHLLRGESSLGKRQAEVLIALAEEYGLELWLSCGYMDLGWAEVQEGHLEVGIERLRRGLISHQATAARLWRPHFLALLGGALAKAGDAQEGLSILEQAISNAEESGENYYLPELHRVKGEILLVPGTTGDDNSDRPARDSFERAMNVAKQQEARSWELRIAMSSHVGLRLPESESDLRSSFEWFQEGHETADLQAAKTLIEPGDGTQWVSRDPRSTRIVA